jgi:hypothetical protein
MTGPGEVIPQEAKERPPDPLRTRWAREKGYLQITDPFDGEVIEVAAQGLGNENDKLDLRFLLQRAADERNSRRARLQVLPGGRPAPSPSDRRSKS